MVKGYLLPALSGGLLKKNKKNTKFSVVFCFFWKTKFLSHAESDCLVTEGFDLVSIMCIFNATNCFAIAINLLIS